MVELPTLNSIKFISNLLKKVKMKKFYIGLLIIITLFVSSCLTYVDFQNPEKQFQVFIGDDLIFTEGEDVLGVDVKPGTMECLDHPKHCEFVIEIMLSDEARKKLMLTSRKYATTDKGLLERGLTIEFEGQTFDTIPLPKEIKVMAPESLVISGELLGSVKKRVKRMIVVLES